jgi:hypothetical protein
LVRLLLDHGAVYRSANGEASLFNEALFCAAIDCGHSNLVRLMLDRGVDPSIEDDKAIAAASRNGDFAVVKARVDPSGRGNLTYKHAALGKYTEVADLIFEDHRVRAHICNDIVTTPASVRNGNASAHNALLETDVMYQCALDFFHNYRPKVELEDHDLFALHSCSYSDFRKYITHN